MPDDKIEIENVSTPGRIERVARAEYFAMRGALLAVLPREAPGPKVAEAGADPTSRVIISDIPSRT